MEQNTKEILKKAGWYEGRKIEIRDIIEFLESKGCYVHEKARKFMEEFGMLNIKTPTSESEEDIKKYNLSRYEKHTTDIYRVFRGAFDSEYPEQFEDYIEEKLVVVGELFNENLNLMIAGSGKLYCEMGKIGDNFDQAWDVILRSKGKIIGWNFLGV